MNWSQVCEDRLLRDLPYKVEFNEWMPDRWDRAIFVSDAVIHHDGRFARP